MTTATRAAAGLIAAAVLAAPAAGRALDPLATFDTAPRKEGETVDRLPNGRAPDAPGDAGTGTGTGTGNGRRNPWYIGFGLGTAGGNVSVGGDSYSLDELNESAWYDPVDPIDVSFNFKIGATLSEQLLVGLDVMSVMSMVSEGNASTSLGIVNYDVVATWFPLGEGLFLRGGAGITRAQKRIDVPDRNFSDSESWIGVNALAGAGVALWLGQSFNLTLNADYSIQRYGSSDDLDPESSDFFAFWVGFDWY